MKKRLGMIDSGLGGVMVLNACATVFPNYDYVFIGDQMHAPYGDKSKEEILAYAEAMIQYLEEQGVEDIIIACNTICANVLFLLQKQFTNLRLYGIITATVKELPKQGMNHILVLATQKTVESHAYAQAIHEWNKDAEVSEVAAVKLVPLLEHDGDEEAIQAALREYLLPFQGKVDAIVLGCTHYPIIKAQIEAIMQVPVYDSNAAVVKSIPFEKQMEPGSIQVFTTKDAGLMHQQIQKIIKKDYEVAELKLDF